MIHKDKNQFSDVLNVTAQRTGFRVNLLEKDYYLTLMLSRINELSEDLVFKGGTCINKIYYSYYRLSEDLDFSMRLPAYEATRGMRRKCIQPIKDGIEKFAGQLGMKIEGGQTAGRNESKQYVYYFVYKSVVQPMEQQIKFEIGLRFNPILKTERKKVQHKFLHPFTGEPMFDGGEVNCLSLKEIAAEKLRAAAIRATIAPRDFYDLDFILRNGFNLRDQEVLDLFQKKLAEDLPAAGPLRPRSEASKADSADDDMAKYRINLGRKKEEIADMKSRIKEELFEVLSDEERKNFNLDSALERINEALKGLK